MSAYEIVVSASVVNDVSYARISKKEKLHMKFDGSTDVLGAALTNVNLLYLVPIAFGLFLLIDFLFAKEKKNFLSRTGKMLLVPLILIVGVLIYLY